MHTIMLTSGYAVPSWALAVALATVACGLILAGLVSLRRPSRSEGWPVAEGTVIESAVVSRNEDGRQTFWPRVRYRYEVGGARYESNRIAWDLMAGFRKFTKARRMLDRYRVGGQVPVRYNPNEPAVAVLQPGTVSGERTVFVVVPIAAAYVVFVGAAVLGG